MAICKSCGAKLKPNERFCLECGTEVDEIVTENEENSKPENNGKTSQPDNNNNMAINIVKPKDISVLKKNVPPPPKKISPKAAAPAPVQDNNSELHTEQPKPAPASYKREVPDIELPEDNRYFAPTYVEGELPPVAHYMHEKRQDDFAKDFYSDSSVTKKGVRNADVVNYYAEQKKQEQKAQRRESIKNRTLYLLVSLLLLLAIAFCFYRFGLLSWLLK